MNRKTRARTEGRWIGGQRARGLALGGALLLLAATGCQSYAAYLHLEEGDEPARLGESERREADAVVEAVALDHDFLRDPAQTRLQQRTRNSVGSSISIISSYVPRMAATGHRITVATAVSLETRGFVILIQDRDAKQLTPFLESFQQALVEALEEAFPRHTIRIERVRWVSPSTDF